MKETIELSVLNELMGENKHKYFLNKENGHMGLGSNYDETQGEYNEYFKFYSHIKLPEGIFMRETYNTDSYGNNDHLVAIQFVKGVEKTIKVFEPIK